MNRVRTVTAAGREELARAVQRLQEDTARAARTLGEAGREGAGAGRPEVVAGVHGAGLTSKYLLGQLTACPLDLPLVLVDCDGGRELALAVRLCEDALELAGRPAPAGLIVTPGVGKELKGGARR